MTADYRLLHCAAEDCGYNRAIYCSVELRYAEDHDGSGHTTIDCQTVKKEEGKEAKTCLMKCICCTCANESRKNRQYQTIMYKQYCMCSKYHAGALSILHTILTNTLFEDLQAPSSQDDSAFACCC